MGWKGSRCTVLTEWLGLDALFFFFLGVGILDFWDFGNGFVCTWGLFARGISVVEVEG